jgi:phosphoesterase RecJ-like protein
MNYKESKQILEEIRKARKILVNCHKSPDPDAVGCALAFYQVLRKLGKKVAVVTPSPVLENYQFLPFAEKIKKVNFKDFDFSKYDLFICPDSSSWAMVVGLALANVVSIPSISIVVIDHHKTNKRFGKINLVDPEIPSAAEIVYLLFEDWKIKIDKDTATALLAGIIGDTGIFQYPTVKSQTFDIARKLMDKGAGKDEIIHNIYRSADFTLLKFWGEILKRMEMDVENKFVWSAIPYEVYKKYSSPKEGKETAASNFTQIVKDTNFGLIMVEEEKNNLSISLRSRTGFDTSKIAVALGGGGHVYASGAKVEDMEFDKAVVKVLQTARKFVKKK